MPITVGRITLYMGPHTLGAPDNLEAAVVGFIAGARHSLDVAVQELESAPIAAALVAARQRGVSVRVVLEGDYLIANPPPPDPDIPSGRNEANRDLFSLLCRAGCEVRTDYNEKIFHQKFVVRDLGGRTRGLLTGSTNFTPTGTHANLNHVVVVEDAYVAGKFADEFEEIWDGTFGAARRRHDDEPGEYHVPDVRVKPLFAPDHAPEMEIMKQMLKARQRIDFAIFTFAQSSGIDDTMIRLRDANLPIQGVLDHGQGAQAWAATQPLVRAGVALRSVRRGSGVNKLHHKLMVLDDQLIIAGSFNYTGPANLLNDENIVVIGDLDATDAAEIAAQRQLAGYARAEIDRIFNVMGTPITAT